MRKIIFFLFIILCSYSLKAQQPAGYTPVADLDKFATQFTAIAKKTETIKSDFVQDKNLGMLSEKITSKGKFWFKKENLLRMEYDKPFTYLMILNKDDMYINDGKKVSRLSVKSSKIFQQINKIIVDCVQGDVFNNPDFKTKAYENKSTYLVELTPAAKTLKEFFKDIDIQINKRDYSVTTIVMNENSGDNTTLHFINRELNVPISDALFAIK
jgi:outer membrane lipoprotein-sorting protein